MPKIAGKSVHNAMPCPVCGAQAEHEFNCIQNKGTTSCLSCGYSSQTEIVVKPNGMTFWAEQTAFPMDENGRPIRGRTN